MARPEIEPKTPLAARLRAFRKKIGDPERDEVAAKIGVSKSALASYERGETEPNASALAAYQREYNANITWLLTGEGDMLDDPSKAPAQPAPAFDIALLQRIGDRVHAIFVECRQRSPVRADLAEAGNIYNELVKIVPDVRDEKMVDAVLPVLLERFRQRIATAEPGSGKRSAS